MAERRIVIEVDQTVDLQFAEQESLVTATVGRFYEGVAERYPDAVIKGGDTPGQPITTPESTESWVRYLAEYKAEMGYAD